MGKHIKMISSFIWYHRIILLFIKIKKKTLYNGEKKGKQNKFTKTKSFRKAAVVLGSVVLSLVL